MVAPEKQLPPAVCALQAARGGVPVPAQRGPLRPGCSRAAGAAAGRGLPGGHAEHRPPAPGSGQQRCGGDARLPVVRGYYTHTHTGGGGAELAAPHSRMCESAGKTIKLGVVKCLPAPLPTQCTQPEPQPTGRWHGLSCGVCWCVCRDVCFATPGGFRDPVAQPWEDRSQPLVPALAGTGSPDGQPADIPSKARLANGCCCY